MGQPNFRVVEGDRPHARDIARVAVKRFRSDAEREKLPLCNQHTEREAKQLLVDDVIAATERVMPEEIRSNYKVNPIVAFWIIVGVLLTAAVIIREAIVF